MKSDRDGLQAVGPIRPRPTARSWARFVVLPPRQRFARAVNARLPYDHSDSCRANRAAGEAMIGIGRCYARHRRRRSAALPPERLAQTTCGAELKRRAEDIGRANSYHRKPSRQPAPRRSFHRARCIDRDHRERLPAQSSAATTRCSGLRSATSASLDDRIVSESVLGDVGAALRTTCPNCDYIPKQR